MKLKLITAAFVTCGLSFFSACDSKKASSSASNKPNKSTECSSKATPKKKAKLTASFNLAETTYDDVKSIIEDECVACHTAGGPGGLDLSTYAALKKSADDVIRTITSDDENEVMPSSGKMSSSKIAKIQAWFDDGKKPGTDEGTAEESDEADDEKDDKEENKKTSNDKTSKTNSDDCEDEGDLEQDDEENSKTDDEESDEEKGTQDDKTEVKKSDLDPELFKLYIEPAEMKACHDDGKTFLRAGTAKDPVDPTPRCDAVTYPAKFTCDKAGVLAAFNNNTTVVAKVEEYVGKGYIFDQCGDAGGKPVVYFVCFKGEAENCVAKDKLTGTNLSILTGAIGRP
jgi:hypothetical protein